MRRIATSIAVTVAIALAVSANACTVGAGTGTVSGDLFVTDCWSGKYDLEPDFFAATPNANDDTLIIRIQRGSDYINFSDGISLLVSHVSTIAGNAACDTTGPPCLAPSTCVATNGTAGTCSPLLGTTLSVSLPPSVVPPGNPIVPDASPANVQFALFLQGTCRPDTPGVYAMSLVTTSTGGDGGIECGADTQAAAAQCGPNAPQTQTGTSTITFQHLFDASLAQGGDPGALTADQRLIEASFDVLLADPREECPGGIGPPTACRGHLTGQFQFYFERGKPAQAFP